MNEKKRRLFFLSCLLTLFTCLKAQPESACLGKVFFNELYHTELEHIQTVLSAKNWLLLSNETDMDLPYQSISLPFNLITWKNTLSADDQYLYLYYRDTLSTFMEITTGKSCFHSLLSHARHYFRRYKEQSNLPYPTDFCYARGNDLAIFIPDSLTDVYTVVFYNKVQIDSLIEEKERQEIAREFWLFSERQRAEQVLQIVDTLQATGYHQQALFVMDTARSFLPEFHTRVAQKRDEIKTEITKIRVSELALEARNLFEQNALHSARQKYREILELDSLQPTATEQIVVIDKKLEVLSARAYTIYDYHVLYPDASETMQRQLYSKLNQYIARDPDGYARFRVQVRFDTLGQNRGNFQIQEVSSSGWDTCLQNLTMAKWLPHAEKEGIPIEAVTNFRVDVHWNSFSVKYRKNDRKIAMEGKKWRFDRKIWLDSLLRLPVFPAGHYKFRVKEKTVDHQISYSTIDLTRYRQVETEAIVYSMLCPGAGTMAATQSSRGLWATLTFFPLLAGSITAWYYGQNLTRSSDPEGANKGKIWKYTALGGLGICGVIYLTDVFTALSKGLKNKEKAKELRKRLREEHIWELLNEPVQ
ncbi:MAG: hypothetical protein LBR51_01920 [Bacteroidales bacterium]|jgi:hypothetical protein|nr:hypothetical protein [Bacteroidales bacterium]